LFAAPGLRETIERRPGWNALLASITLPPALALYLLQGEPEIGEGRWFHLLALALLSAATWSIAFGLLGLSRRHLNEHSPRLRYWADASYWIYLSHFVPMAALAALLLAVQMPGAARLAILVAAILVVVYASYGAFVRHSAIGRVLHGPRPRPERRSVALTPPAGAAAPPA
jgi:peptidoglycan/LPS O-acetylase OafA/YrhL